MFKKFTTKGMIRKRIDIDINGKTPYNSMSMIRYAFVTDKKSGRKLITTFYSCRDFLNDVMTSFYHNSGRYWNCSMPELDTEHLRLIISLPNNQGKVVEKFFSAKRVINMYERLANWSDISTITRVSCGNIKNCWQLVGPKEWMQSSCLVSMLTLIIRVIVREGGFDKLKTLSEVEKEFAHISNNQNTDSVYIKSSFPKYRMLMTNYNELFGQYNVQDLHKDNSRWHIYGGIYSLCTFSTKIPLIDNKMKILWNEYNSIRRTQDA